MNAVIYTLKQNPPVVFRVYKTHKAFRRWCRPLSGPAIACCQSFYRTKRGQGLEQIVLSFSEDHLGAGIVSHEVLHAVLDIHRRRGLKRFPHGHCEELICREVQDYVTAFWNWWLHTARQS